MEKMTHEEYVARGRGRAVELAKIILAGEANVLEAAWELYFLSHEIEVPTDDPDFAVFMAIQDSTEHLPIGRQRAQWTPAAVEAKADEIGRWELWAKEDSHDACHNIIKRFSRS